MPKPKLTKEIILKQLAANNPKFFEEDMWDKYDINTTRTPEECKNVYYHNDGDGKEMRRTYFFPRFNIFVSMIGVYSSWDSSTWNECFESVPYIFSETRYKKKE